MNVLLASEVDRLVAEVEADLNRRIEESVPSVRQRLQELFGRHRQASRGELGKLLDEFMSEQVEIVFNAWRIEEDRKMNGVFAAMSARFAAKANGIIRNIREATARLFEVGVETFESPATLRAETHLYYKLDPLFYFAIDKIPFVLPRFLFRSYVLGKRQDKITMELHRNAGRIRYDYLQRIEQSADQFRKELNLKIDATLSGVQQAIEHAIMTRRTSSAEYAQRGEAYQRDSRELQDVVEHCQALLRQIAA